MKFLTSQELVQLQKILISNTLLQTSDIDFRSALLTNCGLGKYCGLVSLDKPSLQFVISLCAKLSDICITVDGSERLGVVVFLEYISQIDLSLSTDEQHFIQHVINQGEQWQVSKARKQQSPNPAIAASPPLSQQGEYNHSKNHNSTNGLSKLKARLKRRLEDIARKEKQRQELQEKIEAIERRSNFVDILEKDRYEARLEDLKKESNRLAEEIDKLQDEIEEIETQISNS